MRTIAGLRAQRGRIRARRITRRILWYCAAAAGVVLVTLLLGLLQGSIQPNHLQMSYLLLVLVLAIGGGSGPAILASILAFLTFDVFFVKPVGNLLVNDPEEWLALGLFLVVAISTGSLAARLTQSAAEAQRRTSETRTLYELSIAILADTSLERVLGIILDRLATALGLEAATIFLATDAGELKVASHTEVREERAQLARADGEPQRIFASLLEATPADAGADAPARRVQPIEGRSALHGTYVPLALNGRPIGVLAVYGEPDAPPLSDDRARLLDAFAAHTSLAIGRVRLLEEEERSRAAAESDRLKSTFLASISHDLRTPLTAIETAAALLHSEGRREARAEAKAQIDSEVMRLNHLVGNLLEMSRIEGGSAPPRLLPEDVAELVGATADRMLSLLDDRYLELHAADDLPLVLLDAAQFGRVLTNLLENAVKFSPAGTAIRVDISMHGGDVLIRVHNVATSIPPDEQQRIFDKFHRMQGGIREAGGTGLGLAICKGIVEDHGGRIWMRNEFGGVAFYVSLPVAEQDMQTGAAARPVEAVEA